MVKREYPVLIVLGDSTGGRKESFSVWRVTKDGHSWGRFRVAAKKGEAAFAMSNSVLFAYDLSYFQFATGGASGASLVTALPTVDSGEVYDRRSIPVGQHTESSGVFSVASDRSPVDPQKPYRGFSGWAREIVAGKGRSRQMVAVGGDYKQPNDSSASAAYSVDSGRHWFAANTQPHGYRSAVGYDLQTYT